MKTITTLLLTAAIPIAAIAQPTITRGEFYAAGDNITMINSDTTGVRAGAAGAGVTWDFSFLSAGGVYSYSVGSDTEGMFTTSNIVITYSDGSRQFIQENSTDSYLNGYMDASGDTVQYYNLDISRRPITYNTFYNDSNYQVAGLTPLAHGDGSITITGDAYGTLKLPTGNFPNVLRVREVRMEGDSSLTDTTFFTMISYLWFDTTHTAPLLRIDSLIGFNPTTTVRYLAATTAVNNITQNDLELSAALTSNQLLIRSNMQQGQSYSVDVCNIVGQIVYNHKFTASGNTQRFNTDAQLAPGIYIIGLTANNGNTGTKFIKVVKQ